MHKAISIIQFKAEGQLIKEHPEYHMEQRNLLHRSITEHGTITMDMPDENGNLVPHTYTLLDNNFPTTTQKILSLHPRAVADIMDRLSRPF